MVVAPLIAAAAGAIRLDGNSDDVISFHHQTGQMASITASCGPTQQASIRAIGGAMRVPGISLMTQPPSVSLVLNNVLKSCANVPIDVPCVDEGPFPIPLFTCVFKGLDFEVTTGPFQPRLASTSLATSERVVLDCPLPLSANLSAANNGLTYASLKVSARHSSTDIPYAGVVGGDRLEVTPIGSPSSPPSVPPPAPPKPPPSPPPPSPSPPAGPPCYNYGGQCWRMTTRGGTCGTLCGGNHKFNAAASRNTGNDICRSFMNSAEGRQIAWGSDSLPMDGRRAWDTFNGNWVENTCCGAENGHWGGTGGTPSATWSSGYCYIPCVCYP